MAKIEITGIKIESECDIENINIKIEYSPKSEQSDSENKPKVDKPQSSSSNRAPFQTTY